MSCFPFILHLFSLLFYPLTLYPHTSTPPPLCSIRFYFPELNRGGWVSQIRLCHEEAVVMKSGVTPVCHSFSCMLFSFLRSIMLFVFVFSRMLFAFLTYCMLRIPVSLYAICFSYSYLLFVYFSSMFLLVRRGAKKSRLLGGVLYLLLCCTDVSTVIFSIV